MDDYILVVTDDDEVRDDLFVFFSRSAFHLTSGEWNMNTILKIINENYNFFILDLNLNGSECLQFTHIIRKIKPTTPVVVLIDKHTLEIRRQLAELGVFYFATKPIQPAEMELVLEAFKRLQKRWKSSMRNVIS